MTLKANLEPTRNWLPDPRRMMTARNDSYIRSFVAGVFSPLFHLPQMVWGLILRPLIYGIGAVIAVLVINFLAGVVGYCTGFDICVTDNDKPLVNIKA